MHDKITFGVLTYDTVHNKQGLKIPFKILKFKHELLSYMLEIINSFYVAIESRTVRELS